MLLVAAPLAVLISLGSFSNNAITPLLPSVASTYGVALASVELSITAYVAVLAAGQLIWGFVADIITKRTVVIACLICMLAGDVLTVLASGYGGFVFGRGLEAFGSAGFLVISRVVVRSVAKGQHLAQLNSLISAVAAFIAAGTPLLGGLAGLADWRWTIFMTIGASLLAGSAALIGMRTAGRQEPPPTMSWAGYAQLMTSGRYLGSLAVSALCYGALGVAFISISSAPGIGTLPVLIVGAIGSAIMIGYTVGSTLLLRFSDRSGLIERSVHVVCLLSAFSCVVVGFLAKGSITETALYAAFLVSAGLAFGVIQPIVVTRAMSSIPNFRGTASAMLGTTQALTAALVIAIGAAGWLSVDHWAEVSVVLAVLLAAGFSAWDRVSPASSVP